MDRPDFKHLLVACITLAIVMATALWSWNTLASLFGAPEAQLKHAVAALALLAIVRLTLRRRRHAISDHHHP